MKTESKKRPCFRDFNPTKPSFLDNARLVLPWSPLHDVPTIWETATGYVFSGCKLSILVLLYSVLYFVIPALYGCFYLAFYILSVLGCISVLGFVLRLSQNLDCISVFGLGFSIFEFCSFWFLSATVYIWWSSASKSKHWKQLTSVEHVQNRAVARFFYGEVRSKEEAD